MLQTLESRFSQDTPSSWASRPPKDENLGGSFRKSGPFGVLFIRVLCYIGDLKRDPNLENHPHRGLYRFTVKGLGGYVIP